jgi:hypothetical protein
LRNVLDVIAGKEQLILLCFRLCDCHTVQHLHVSYSLWGILDEFPKAKNGRSLIYLLTQEIANLYCLPFFLDDTVDREMGIHCAHFVRESLQIDEVSMAIDTLSSNSVYLCDASDHVRDKTLDSP